MSLQLKTRRCDKYGDYDIYKSTFRERQNSPRLLISGVGTNKKNHGGSDKVYIRNVRLFLGLDEEATIDNICRALDELKGEQIEVHNLLSSLETKVALDVNKITKIYELFYDALAKKG